MSIRITTTIGAATTIVKIDGRLRSDDVGELRRAFRSVQGETALDLSELLSVDQAGVDILREIVASGARVRKATPYIDLLLRGTT